MPRKKNEDKDALIEKHERNQALIKRIEEGDTSLRVLETGAILDENTKKLVGHAGGGNLWTADDVRRMARERRKKIHDAFIEGMGIAMLEKGINLKKGRDEMYLQAIKFIVAHQVDLATDIAQGRASTEAAKWLVANAKDIGLVSPEAEQHAAAAGGMAMQFQLSGEAAARLLQIMDQRSDNGK